MVDAFEKRWIAFDEMGLYVAFSISVHLSVLHSKSEGRLRIVPMRRNYLVLPCLCRLGCN